MKLPLRRPLTILEAAEGSELEGPPGNVEVFKTVSKFSAQDAQFSPDRSRRPVDEFRDGPDRNKTPKNLKLEPDPTAELLGSLKRKILGKAMGAPLSLDKPLDYSGAGTRRSPNTLASNIPTKSFSSGKWSDENSQSLNSDTIDKMVLHGPKNPEN
jgi:hypothetical protein